MRFRLMAVVAASTLPIVVAMGQRDLTREIRKELRELERVVGIPTPAENAQWRGFRRKLAQKLAETFNEGARINRERGERGHGRF
jgi:hypothetical protein